MGHMPGTTPRARGVIFTSTHRIFLPACDAGCTSMTPPDLATMHHLERPLARTPFGDAWAARDDNAPDARVMVVALAPELCTLVRDPARLAAALRARVGSSTSVA